MIKFFHDHGTKVIGFAQVTVGVLATATHVFSEAALQYQLLVSGLLTAWRGFFYTAMSRDDGKDSGV